VLDSVYEPNINKPRTLVKNTVNLTLDKDKLNSPPFQELGQESTAEATIP
jgi:hypothetical protein